MSRLYSFIRAACHANTRAMPYHAPLSTQFQKGYLMAAGLTLMGTGLYNYKRPIQLQSMALAEELETEHDRLFKAIYTQIPDILDKQGTQINQEFRDMFAFSENYEGFERSDGKYFLKSRDTIDKPTRGVVYQHNMFSVHNDCWVKHDQLTIVEKVYGVCCICGVAIPGDRIVSKQTPSHDGSKMKNHMMHSKCWNANLKECR